VNIKIALCLASLLSSVLVPQAMAQYAMDLSDDSQPPSPWYFGFGLSRSDATVEQSSLDTISGGALAEIDDRFNGFQFYVGRAFGRFLAFELGGGRIGNSSISFSNGESMEYTFSSVVFGDLVVVWPGSEKWALIVRVGATIGETRISVSNLPLTNDQKDETDANIKFGVGAQYYFTRDAGGRLEVQHYTMPDPVSNDDVSINTLVGSIFFRF
jgi:hypothetical protein